MKIITNRTGCGAISIALLVWVCSAFIVHVPAVQARVSLSDLEADIEALQIENAAQQTAIDANTAVINNILAQECPPGEAVRGIDASGGIICGRFASMDISSCLSILNSELSSGDGVYTIDPDGPGGGDPYDVYCDMTTDGGGWTLVASTAGTTLNDQASVYYDDLTTLNPIAGHEGIWDGMRSVITGNSDIRFSCKTNPANSDMTVDLSFYDIHWYREITTGTDEQSCFNEGNGAGYDTPAPARRNNITGATLPLGDDWNYGYLEGEDFCGDIYDFTVDFDDRGMDTPSPDYTEWGEDDGTRKCGSYNDSNGAWFIWVR